MGGKVVNILVYRIEILSIVTMISTVASQNLEDNMCFPMVFQSSELV